jgi:hypothetical protein
MFLKRREKQQRAEKREAEGGRGCQKSSAGSDSKQELLVIRNKSCSLKTGIEKEGRGGGGGGGVSACARQQ